MEEIWKKINGFDNYLISNIGRVLNNKTNTYKIPTPNEKGYMRVFLRKNNKNYTKYVHRLVAEAFIPNPENKPTVNHEDGNKENNDVLNLTWATQKEQMEHALKIGLIKVGEKNPCFGRKLSNETIEKLKIKRNLNKDLFNKPINQYELNGTYIKTWDSINDAIKFYNNKAIEFCCKGRRKSASGYQWRFYNGNIDNIEPKTQNQNETHVIQCDLNGNPIKKFLTIRQACEEVNAKSSNIVMCCKNFNKTCKGYKWRYESEVKKMLNEELERKIEEEVNKEYSESTLEKIYEQAEKTHPEFIKDMNTILIDDNKLKEIIGE